VKPIGHLGLNPVNFFVELPLLQTIEVFFNLPIGFRENVAKL
jgi:hypothetical protein